MRKEINLLLCLLPRGNRDHRPALLAVERQRKIRTNDRNAKTTDARYYSMHRRIVAVNNKGGGSKREKHPPSWLLRVEYECGGVCDVTEAGDLRGGAFKYKKGLLIY